VLHDPVKTVVGDRTAKILHAGLEIETVGDLLRHYPRRYAERGELTDLSSLEIDEFVTVMARIDTVSLRATRPSRGRKGSLLEVVVTDGRGRLRLTFFNQAWRQQVLVAGRVGLFSGKVTVFNGRRQLTHPDYVLVSAGTGQDPATELDEQAAAEAAVAFARALIPVYPATQGLNSWQIAKCVGTVLDTLPELPDPLPADLLTRRGLLPLADAYRLIHRPESRADVAAARQRLVFEEAFVLQAELARRRAATAALPAVPRVARPGGVLESFDSALPFELTAGQVDVGREVSQDLSREHPMHRLLQGEVGAGKTLVALRAMLAVVDSGGQAAMLAPTEVLAAQHHRSISAMLGPLAERGLLGGSDTGTRVALLTGSMGSAARRQALLDAASGEAGIVIGTHALLQERVGFFDLGLVVVDEQHRFGVEQRAALTAKGASPPHVLVMTATPIPRTVAMTVFGDLDVSTLTELPSGRSTITTHVVPAGDKPHFLDRAWQRVREEVADGHQAYVVCPRIGGSEANGEADTAEETQADPDDAEQRRPPVAVLDLAPALADGPLAGLRVEVMHGRMASEAKDDVMRRFAAGTVDVLVATTVVEVGVDVPNATVMVVMDADRFGVSQLHQLRGRIGRGSAPGLALLVTELDQTSPARARLDAVEQTLDGFALSRIDLEARREGDVLGAAQAGKRSSLRLLSVLRDEDVIVDARSEASAVVAGDPELAAHPELLAALSAYVDTERGDYMEKT
jgi:ATP-dependent DNA helicase RecG